MFDFVHNCMHHKLSFRWLVIFNVNFNGFETVQEQYLFLKRVHFN